MKELLPITIAVFVKYTQIYVIQWKKGLSSHMSENTKKTTNSINQRRRYVCFPKKIIMNYWLKSLAHHYSRETQTMDYVQCASHKYFRAQKIGIEFVTIKRSLNHRFEKTNIFAYSNSTQNQTFQRFFFHVTFS